MGSRVETGRFQAYGSTEFHLYTAPTVGIARRREPDGRYLAAVAPLEVAAPRHKLTPFEKLQIFGGTRISTQYGFKG